MAVLWASALRASRKKDAELAAQKDLDAKKEKEREEMCKEAVSRARNMHGRWDRTRREWEGLLTRSEGHPNTVGCKFEVDLRNLVAVLVGVDEKMMVVEKAQLSKTPLDDVAIRESGDHATRLHEAMKEGCKKKNALGTWMKVPC